MPHVYREVQSLERHALIDGGDCVALIKALAPGLKGLATSSWRPGVKVVDSRGLQPGTAIATFVDGRYPNKRTGNHAAFFLSYSGNAIWVMDQWKNDDKRPWVASRLIRPALKHRDGTLRDPSNAAEAYYVIEMK